MKSFVFLITMIWLCMAQSQTVSLEKFAAKAEFKIIKISPDGKHIAYTYEDGDRVKLGTMDLKNKQGIYSFDVGKNREISYFEWLNNKRILFVGTNITGHLDGAKKNPKVYITDLDGKNRAGLPLGFSVLSLLEKDDDYILVEKYNKGTRLHKININNMKSNYLGGEPKPIGTMHSSVDYIILDNNDIPRIAYEFDPVDLDDFDDNLLYLHIRQPAGEWTNFKIDNKRKTRPVFFDLGFNITNDKFYFVSNYDLNDKGTNALFEYDFNTNKIQLLFRHPDTDIINGVYGKNGEFIGAFYEAGFREYFYINDDSSKTEINYHKSLVASFPDSKTSLINYTKNKAKAIMFVRSDQNPGDFYILERKDNKLSYLASVMPSINPKEMAKVEPFTMQARDGLKMFGQLTLPPGKPLKDLPMIVYPHGGPYGVRDYWGWQERPQMLANNGYLVLQLNFRGSGGYGESFEEAGYHEWGAKMQDDITDATLWAINMGYADKDRVCIHGISYGGYASMQAVVKEPDLYQCSIPDAGPYDLDYQLKKADSFKGNTKLRKWFFTRMLGENYAQLNSARSPAYHVDKLKADLMIVHGKKDIRVPIGNAYLLEDKLKDQGIKYETVYKKDGHGFQNVTYRVELYEKMLKFLNQSIGEK